MIESYTNPETYQWYRVYSDGWCEQGGFIGCLIGTNTPVTLLKSYLDSNYSAQVTYNTNATGTVNGTPVAINLKTTSGFSIGSQGGSYNWVTKGYINLETS